ncbi:MAG: hypothetical protein QM528_02795 [Phycisphaerales bacterium]|nr:hypothetical protein [Phycisphaerales bacterium]
MKIFEANIKPQVSDFLHKNLKKIESFEKANQKIYSHFGIINFFNDGEELERLKGSLSVTDHIVEESNRVEYGDFQTNTDLANKVTIHLTLKGIYPEVLIEPTCGKGNFIIASLRTFPTIKYVFGIEIYKPYIWETKFSIIDFFLSNPIENKPEILIIHTNVFSFDFKAIAQQHATNDILIIGNPPWVTNAKLGSLNSINLPKKTNFKNHSGLDAMTGKGNFDIAEFITITMIQTFQNMKGHVLFLVKNSVIKNIVFDQKKNHYKISSIEKHCIDSKKEFKVSVEAALFYCQLNAEPAIDCTEFDFYNNQHAQRTFGWINNKFVSNLDTYIDTQEIDGTCPFMWRQGLKHDCSIVMELDKVHGHYVNGLKEAVEIEESLVYGILKSSDLKNTVITETRKFTIVTQKKIGQETAYIKNEYPKTYQYLLQHIENFKARKSSIYNNKPVFSIFGIGDYSFKPFKVAISGLYKKFHCTLILSQNNKPVMVDDTCYLIGFDKIEFAVYALILLNAEPTVQFLKSITFPDAKRTFTKEILMRIDLLQLAKKINKTKIQSELNTLNEKYELNLNLFLWDSFINEMTRLKNGRFLTV